MRKIMGFVLPALIGLGAAYFYGQWTYRAGFDDGAAAMQCVDYVAVMGNEAARPSAPCVEARA